jgi:hypothetical protein
MKKMQEKSKIYNIHAKAPTPPQTKENYKLPLKPSHMDGKHQSPPPPQSSKSRRIKGFGENVSKLSLGVYIPHLNVSLLYIISQKVVSPLNMSHFLWKTRFLATEMTLVLSHMRGTLSNLTPKSLIVCN